MDMRNRTDEIALWQMYIHAGTQAIGESPDADGVTIIRTVKGTEYRFPYYMDKNYVPEILAALRAAGDVHVRHLVHIWKNHWLDVPSYSLRQALLALHPQNADAHLMLIGEENFVFLSVRDTML